MPRRLWIMSDLHQELARFPWAPPRPDFDVLVVAGDVFRADVARAVDWVADLAGGRPCVFVPGNHEYWQGEPGQVLAAGSARAAERGVTFLDGRGGWTGVGGVSFAGGTLWTDQALNLPMGERLYPEAFGEPILAAPGGGLRIPGAAMLARHLAEVDALEAALGADPLPPGPRVVVTHHAPHQDSMTPAWRDHRSAAFAASDLCHLLDAAACDLWVHGHVHHSLDYRAPLGTRVVCNPFGYHGDNERFDEALVVEVG